MASSGSFNTNAYGSGDYYRYLNFSWSVKSQNVALNTTTISWTLKGAGGSTSSWVQSGNFKVVINGTTVYSSATRIELYNGTTVASGTFSMSHDREGNKSFSASAEAGIYYVAVNCSGSGSWTLPQIPRYPSVSQSLNSKTETSITMNYSSDSVCDYLWYSTNGGSSWTGVNITDGTSGSYTISGLSAGTTYSIKTRLRRRDSQLTKDSSALSVATYSYPYADSMPSFTIGDKLTVGVYNPLGRTFTITAIGADNSQLAATSSYSGTSVSGFNNTTFQNFWYASLANAKSGTYKIKITYGSISTTKTGGTYSVSATDSSPTIGTFTYADVNSTVTAITGNNQKIVQNQSTVRFTATGLAGKNSATISSAKVLVNGNTYNLTLNTAKTTATGGNIAIDSSTNVVATLTVTDSRGISATKTVTITMLPWSLPTAIITLQRHNNYYSATDITVDASYASVDSKNTITIQARYKQTTVSSYSSWNTLSDNVTSTFTLDNNYAWDVQVQLTDRFGGTTTYNTSVGMGLPIIYFDRLLSSVGINCFPVDEKSLEVNGFNVQRSIMTRGLSAAKTSLSVNTYTKIPLNLSNSTGSKLTATSDGGIKIGAGVSKVLVSAKMAVEGVTTAGNRHLRIVKNTYTNANTLGWAWDSLAVSDSEDIVITPQLVDVTEGDVIYAMYYTGQSTDKIGGNAQGGRTSLTVEAVA